MKYLLIVLLLGCLYWTLGAGHSFSVKITQTPCTPRNPSICGDPVLLSQESSTLAEYGPNVCSSTKYYEVMTFAYVEATYCFGGGRGRFCVQPFCQRTANCMGPLRNVTTVTTDCCDGFAVDPDAKPSRRYYSRRSAILRESGCTLMLRNSITDCLLELNLDSFTVQLLLDAPDFVNQLGEESDSNGYTVFAVNDSVLENTVPVNLLGHIVNKTVEGKKLRAGTVFRTLSSDTLLHVGSVAEESEKSIFINGVNVTQLNACQARNGIVHIVDAVIPQSKLTIAEILRQDSEASSFLRLLDGANITRFLDVAQGKSRTLLCPSDDAFEKLPDGAIECLLREENRNFLNQLVLIHIGSPAEYSSTLSQRSRFFTFNTRYYLFVDTEGDDIVITRDRIPLDKTDIPATNGVVHTIPEVIVPPEVDFDKLCDGDVSGAL